MSTASPTPLGSSHPAAPTRKPSLRLGLRRIPSRPRISRVESNPALSTANAPSKSHLVVDVDSSDEELPVPMKLSALTKALLNDDAPEPSRHDNGSRVRTRSRSFRPSSPARAGSAPLHEDRDRSFKRRSLLGASASAAAARAEEKRHTRASSAQASSRPPSPDRDPGEARSGSSFLRKRVVRLSANPSVATAFKSLGKKSESPASQEHRNRSLSRESPVGEKGDNAGVDNVNTPVARNARSVRIVVESSERRARSVGNSSGVSSRKTDVTQPASESEAAEDPVTAPRQRISAKHGTAPRQDQSGVKSRAEEASQALQGSMRVKRVGKIRGSFLSGPARRGRRRQSEEDAEDAGEALANHEADSQLPGEPADVGPAERMASSYYAPDRIASGSPVGSKKETGQMSGRASPVQDEIAMPQYKMPPPRPGMPSRGDQENDAPPPFRKNKVLDSAVLERHAEMAPVCAMNVEAVGMRPSSPGRRPLASINQNTALRAAPLPPPKISMIEAATSAAGATTAQQGSKRRNYFKVNDKFYTRLDSLGRGGSAKVYRVAADNGKMLALKRVSYEQADDSTVRGYKGEIDLLRKLAKVDRVISLYDFELNDEKQILSLVMEMGELDLNTLLRIRMAPENAKFDPVFVRFYWQEMLECLAAVHAYDIVHSDLKPANFVLVQGRLKLIDFGIANAIQTDETVNVHRETQIGTPNYMSPESLLDSNAIGPDGQRVGSHSSKPKLMKLGKPSDVWSLGCILFQMVYGTPPFGHIANQMSRCHAIIDWQFAIEFRSHGVGHVPVPASLLRTMKRCLTRDQHLRPACEELLSQTDPFLYPVETTEGHLPVSEELLGRIIQSVVTRCRERMPSDAEALSVWPSAYWGSIAKAVSKDSQR